MQRLITTWGRQSQLIRASRIRNIAAQRYKLFPISKEKRILRTNLQTLNGLIAQINIHENLASDYYLNLTGPLPISSVALSTLKEERDQIISECDVCRRYGDFMNKNPLITTHQLTPEIISGAGLSIFHGSSVIDENTYNTVESETYVGRYHIIRQSSLGDDSSVIDNFYVELIQPARLTSIDMISDELKKLTMTYYALSDPSDVTLQQAKTTIEMLATCSQDSSVFAIDDISGLELGRAYSAVFNRREARGEFRGRFWNPFDQFIDMFRQSTVRTKNVILRKWTPSFDSVARGVVDSKTPALIGKVRGQVECWEQYYTNNTTDRIYSLIKDSDADQVIINNQLEGDSEFKLKEETHHVIETVEKPSED